MKLIDKDALIALIDDLLDDEFQCDSYNEAAGFQNALTKIKEFINTFDAKEVNLELNSSDATVCKIGNTYFKKMNKDDILKALEDYQNGDKIIVQIRKK